MVRDVFIGLTFRFLPGLFCPDSDHLGVPENLGVPNARPSSRDRSQANPLSGKYARTRDYTRVKANFLKEKDCLAAVFSVEGVRVLANAKDSHQRNKPLVW